MPAPMCALIPLPRFADLGDTPALFRYQETGQYTYCDISDAAIALLLSVRPIMMILMQT